MLTIQDILRKHGRLVDISKYTDLRRLQFHGKKLTDTQINLARGVFAIMFADETTD